MLSKASYATLIPVRKMNRAITFYTETLGGKVIRRGEGEMKNFWAQLEVAGSQFWLIIPEDQEKRKLAYSVFVVKNIKSAVNGLLAKGVKFAKAETMSKDSKVDGPISRDPGMGASAFFKDSEGNLLMLWEEM